MGLRDWLAGLFGSGPTAGGDGSTADSDATAGDGDSTTGSGGIDSGSDSPAAGGSDAGGGPSSDATQTEPAAGAHLSFPEDAGEPDHVPPGALIGDDLADVREMAQDYAGMWSEFDPDYSVASIPGIDEMFATQQDRANWLKLDLDDGRTGAFAPMAAQPACYFGEVMCRNYDAEWVKDPDYGWALGFRGEHIVNLFGTVHRALDADPPFVSMHDTFVDNYDLDGEPLDADGERIPEVRQEAGPDPDAFDDEEIAAAAADERTTAEDMADFAADFVENHPEYDLDYSTGSLAAMDAVVDDQFRTGQFADAEIGSTDDEASILLTAVTTEAGGYFGEVIRRTTDADWQYREDDGLKMEFPIEGAEVRVDPVGMAQSVIEDDESFRDRYDQVREVVAEVAEELPEE